MNDGIIILNDGRVSDFSFYDGSIDGANGMNGQAIKFDKRCSDKILRILEQAKLIVTDLEPEKQYYVIDDGKIWCKTNNLKEAEAYLAGRNSMTAEISTRIQK